MALLSQYDFMGPPTMQLYHACAFAISCDANIMSTVEFSQKTININQSKYILASVHL
jgi:hypothetical protein